MPLSSGRERAMSPSRTSSGALERQNFARSWGLSAPRLRAAARPRCQPKPEERPPMSKWLLSLPVLCTIAIWLTPEQITPRGTWVASADAQTASVSGRVAQPTWKKLNPVWWFLNDDEPDPPDWQLPGKPYLIRQLSWYARNPLQNFGRYVVGVSDRNYTVVGAAPVMRPIGRTWSPAAPAGRPRRFTSAGCVFPMSATRASTSSGTPGGNGRDSSASSST
jgi:hypothetical protein